MNSKHGDSQSKNHPADKKPLSRRKFFQSFLAKSISSIDEMRGIPQCRLDELAQLPDAILEKMIPQKTNQEKYRCENDLLLKMDKKTIARRFNDKEMFIIKLFNGASSLGEISQKLVEDSIFPSSGEAFKAAKSLFCELACLMIYVPASPHTPEMEKEEP